MKRICLIVVLLLFAGSSAFAAGVKMMDLPAQTENLASDDSVIVNDKSDQTDSADGSTKVESIAGLQDFMEGATNSWTGTNTFTGTVNLPAAIVLPDDSVKTATIDDSQVESNHYIDGSIDAEHIAEYTLSPIILAEPDVLQPIADAWPLYQFLEEAFPSGVTITSIHVKTSAACTDALNFEEWAQQGTSAASTVEAITLSGTYTEDDGTLADANIAADGWLYVDLVDAAAGCNVGFMAVTISFTSQ